MKPTAIKAVKLYIKYDLSTADAVRELGHSDYVRWFSSINSKICVRMTKKVLKMQFI